MALQYVLVFMVYQTDVAVDTLRDIVTMFAFYSQGEATSVLEQDDLVFLLERPVHSLDERAAEVGLQRLTTR